MREYLVRRLFLLTPEALKLEYVTTARAKGLFFGDGWRDALHLRLKQ
jgi:hypothetical protein